MRHLILCAMFVAGSLHAAEPDLTTGLAAYENGEYVEALRHFEPLAEAGLAEAQYRLGRMYYQGRFVARDERIARKWLLRSAHQGHARAQYMAAFLALWPLEPGGRIQAYAWFSLAAEQGNAFAAERRDILGRHMGKEDVARARELARSWSTSASG